MRICLRLSYDSQVRDSTVQRYGKSQDVDQLEERMKEKPIPYISHDKFIRKSSFTIGMVVYQVTLMSTKHTRMSLRCGDSSMVALHLETG